MINKKPRRRYDLVIFGTLTLLAVAMWVALETYRNFNKPSDLTPVAPFHTRTLTPTLDTVVLERLEQRMVVSRQTGLPGDSL